MEMLTSFHFARMKKQTRMFLHALEMSKKGLKKVLIIANDTDVLVIAVAHFFLLDLEELWVRHDAGTKTRFTN